MTVAYLQERNRGSCVAALWGQALVNISFARLSVAVSGDSGNSSTFWQPLTTMQTSREARETGTADGRYGGARRPHRDHVPYRQKKQPSPPLLWRPGELTTYGRVWQTWILPASGNLLRQTDRQRERKKERDNREGRTMDGWMDRRKQEWMNKPSVLHREHTQNGRNAVVSEPIVTSLQHITHLEDIFACANEYTLLDMWFLARPAALHLPLEPFCAAAWPFLVLNNIQQTQQRLPLEHICIYRCTCLFVHRPTVGLCIFFFCWLYSVLCAYNCGKRTTVHRLQNIKLKAQTNSLEEPQAANPPRFI